MVMIDNDDDGRMDVLFNLGMTEMDGTEIVDLGCNQYRGSMGLDS